MNDERKTKKQLIHQLAGLRQRVAELEAAETGRAQAEAKLRRANRALRVLSDCNQAVVRATEEASLRRQVCRILVETGGYRLAWIGFAEQDEARTMRPVAQAGFEEGYLQTLNLTWADTERGRGPTGTAIRSGQPALARNIPTDPNFAPWRAEATRRGYASSLALPLIAGGQTLGALNIYAAEPDAFDAKEISLLTELANDLAFGIATLRTRAEHRRAEAALRDSEARYRSLFDSTRDGLYVIDMQGRYLDANPAACRLLGYSRRELLAMDIFQVRAGYQTLSPEERAQLLARYQTLWQTGTTGYESLLAAKSGTTIPVEMSITPVNYHGRQAVLGAVRDITERKKAEQTLRESEQRLSLIFDTVGDVLFLLAVEPNDVFRFESVNRAFLTATGLHEEQIVGRRIQEVIPESAHKLVLGKYKEAIRKKKTVTWEEVSAYPSGEKTGLVAVTPAFNREGVCTQLVGSVHDLTARVQAEAALRESEEKFRILTESSPVGIFLDDAEGNAIYVNDRCAELVGLPPEECLKFNWVPSIHPDDRERVTGEWAKAVERGELFQLEYRWVHANGRIVWTLGKVAPVKNQSGQVICYVGTLVDITERKRIAAEKEELAAQFYQSQKMDSIGQLAGGVAHDFNNLLVPIMGYADLGMLKLSPDNVHYTQFKRIKAAAERAAGLTRQILAFSRRQILKMNILNLNDVAASFREMLHRLIGEDISLQMHLAADLQPIEADKAQLEQVLLNLAVNARDAMPNGGKLTIETANALLDEAYVARHAGSQPGPHVMLAVSDTGSGMDAETRRRIFEPFFTTKKRGRGTGLGLSTVFGIVKQHGGNIWVYSEPNRGTTFKLYFPITKAAAPTGEAAPPESGSLRGAETVLVVEDESSVRKLVVETLRSNGYHILEAGGPVEGLEAAAASPDTIHLLLTDVIMPDMSGQELYLQLVRVRPDLKVLYMSGYTDNVIAHHGVLQEGVTLLQKPFTIRSLLQTIRSVLR